MTDRRKDLLFLTALLVLLILFYSRILFTGKVISAPDIINEFYWGVVETWQNSLAKLLDPGLIKAAWNREINSGTTTLGGNSSIHFLVWLKLIFNLIPPPASVAWFIVLHLFFGAAGVFCYCRIIGLSRFAALFAGAVFALAPENASLINAGHVMKIATISYAPWAFYCLERGFRSRRLFWFLTTGFVLAVQFFNNHWQIAFYTCLCVGTYAVFRIIAVLRSSTESDQFPTPRLLGMNLAVMLFFLSTVAISLVPLAEWSKDTNRGVQSGANQGRGGLDREEAMSWSLPPEEVGAFIIPGFFGLSRQEGGENPKNIASYYWGRMVFTQTVSYMGLLPWLLAPLPLIFRRNRYTWLAVCAVVGGVLFSMGKYTPFYNLLFDYFPGINRFRVPKMMMFIPVAGIGVLAAMGIDIFRDEEIRKSRGFRQYLFGLLTVPFLLLLLYGVELIGSEFLISSFSDMLSQPTRYEQGPQLITQRWDNLVTETGFAAGLATLCTGTLLLFGRKGTALRMLPAALLVLYLIDTWRINDKFMFLINVPEKTRMAKSPLTEFLSKDGHQYRVLPLNGEDPMHYVSLGIPVMFTSNAVQQQRWQEFLDIFSLKSAMPDILNVRHLIYGEQQYEQEKAGLGDKYRPVYRSMDGSQVVVENMTVLPKAWLVPAVVPVTEPRQALAVLPNPVFNPVIFGTVESPPPFPMDNPERTAPFPMQSAGVTTYEDERIEVKAVAPRNALLVLGEKYYQGWRATVDGKPAEIVPVNYILRGVYLPPGSHTVEFIFDPLPFKVGKWLTLTSFAVFAMMLGRELVASRRQARQTIGKAA